MVGRTKQEFAQEAPATPFKTVLLSDLERALEAHRLYDRIPRDPPRRKARSGWFGEGPFVWVRRPLHPLIQRARQWAALQIRGDLQNGVLLACMPTETAGVFLRIPPQFWHERRSRLRVEGMLFDLTKNTLVPDEIDEGTFCVLEEGARSWLACRKIVEDNPAFPDALRTAGPVRTKTRPSDKQIIAQGKQMNKMGLKRDVIAREMRKIPGYENVGNVLARDLMTGNLPRGRPKKEKKTK